jgi:hypothetical protein
VRDARAIFAGSLRTCHLRLEVDAQTVGDAVDVIEIRDDLGGVMDGAVIEADGAEAFDVGVGDGSRVVRQLHRVVAEGAILFAQPCLRIVSGDLLGPLWIIDLGPEVRRVGQRSVMAAVGGRHDDGQHLPLRPGQR